MSVPNVLAVPLRVRRAAGHLVPEHKVLLERQLWLAVLEAQRDLGIEVPDRWSGLPRVVDLGEGRRPRVDRGARAGDPSRREGADRGSRRSPATSTSTRA